MSQQTDLAESDDLGAPSNAHGMHRRSFLTGTATGFVGGGAVAVGAFAFRSPEAPNTDDAEPQSEAPSSPKTNATEVDRIVSSIQSRFLAANLDDRDLAQIREQVAAQLVRSRVLSDFKFDTNDRPANLFVPAQNSISQSERD